ncbi:Hypothetical protein SRAE_1000254600 [Strongyloides ratti]|uniref:Uncharacterized protein n=1 Tax=Strongyloides ratti TaxID=34506 RepID=A0A090L3B1_STRRB|nr:Hypothetical protein SRAE_1000254600 [Strongyloides ratti]CEF64291.1 Hypothetical protein SRAE_1000254600 [Strongyloides ratti]
MKSVMFKAILALSFIVISLQEKQIPSLKDIESYNDPILKEIFYKIQKTTTSNYKNQDSTNDSVEFNQQHFIGNNPTFNRRFATSSNVNQEQTPEFKNSYDYSSFKNIALTPNNMVMLANDGYNAFINGARQLSNTIPGTLSNGAMMFLG